MTTPCSHKHVGPPSVGGDLDVYAICSDCGYMVRLAVYDHDTGKYNPVGHSQPQPRPAGKCPITACTSKIKEQHLEKNEI